MRLGFGEILLILVIALVVFGPSKLPQLGEALGRGITNLQTAPRGPAPAEESDRGSEPARLGSGTPAATGAGARNEQQKV